MYHKDYLYDRIVRAKSLMDSHYATGLSITEIADIACFSRFHFLRLFRSAYRITPHQYLTRLRIRRAKELLAGNLSVRETCSKVGFTSTSSFIHLFHSLEKCTPTAYAARMTALKKDQAAHPLNHVPQCFAEYMHWKK